MRASLTFLALVEFILLFPTVIFESLHKGWLYSLLNLGTGIVIIVFNRENTGALAAYYISHHGNRPWFGYGLMWMGVISSVGAIIMMGTLIVNLGIMVFHHAQ